MIWANRHPLQLFHDGVFHDANRSSALATQPILIQRVIGAAIEAFDLRTPTLFGDMSEIPGPGVGGAIIKAYIAVHPLLALAALALATIGRLRYAIMALGALVLMNWLNDMPSVVRHGLDFNGLSAFETPMQIIAFPLMGACAIALAARSQRLGLATLLVAFPRCSA